MRVAPIIVAHRGLHQDAPENSLEAFRAAERAGIGWVEFDVQESRDGHPVIIHDDTLERTTMSCGPVSARRGEEIGRVHLRGAGERPHAGVVPVLIAHRGLSAVRALRLSLLIEVKPPDARRLVQKLVEALRGSAMPWAIQSFDVRNLEHARTYAREVPAFVLAESTRELRLAVASRWRGVHACHELLDRSLVEHLHGQGRSVGAWTVNEPKEIRRCCELGVDVIITDEPLAAGAIVEEMQN